MAEKKRTEPRWTALPAAKSSAAGLRLRLALVLGFLALTSVAGIAAAAAWLGYEAPTVDLEVLEQYGRAEADAVARAFVAGEPAPVAVAEGVTLSSSPFAVAAGPDWDSFERFDLDGGTFEEHCYRVLLDGFSYAHRLCVLLAVSSDGAAQARLASAPYMQRAPGFAANADASYSGRVDSDTPLLPAQARTRIEEWADAFAADDSRRLGALTGDGATDVRYLGLGGHEVLGVTITTAVPAGGDRWLVRVRLTLLPAGVQAEPTALDVDVTVSDGSTGNPLITGWGPALIGITSPGSVREPG